MPDRKTQGNPHAGEAAHLVALLTEQCELYRELSGLAEHQRSLIDGNQAERLLGVLGQRQTIIDRLSMLAERMRPYQRSWQTIRQGLSPDESRRVDHLVAQVNDYLSAILAQDKADVELLATRKGETATAMSQLKASRRAGAAYAAAGGVERVPVEWTDQ